MSAYFLKHHHIFLKTDVQDINLKNLDMIQHYPTRTGRRKDTLESITTNVDYYSLKDASALLGISPNKVAVLVQKGILRKKENNPISVQIEACSLLNLKNKLLSDEFISYLDAAKRLNCPINWMKKYWVDTGFLDIKDLVYWKLIYKNELTEVLDLKEEFITGAEASSLLGMRHSHVTNLQKQGLIKPHYFGKTDKKVRLFNKNEVLKFVIQ